MSDELVLVHYGTKGMRWGFRKQEPESTTNKSPSADGGSPSTAGGPKKPLHKQKRVIIPAAAAAIVAVQMARNPIVRDIIKTGVRYPSYRVKYKDLAPPHVDKLVHKYLGG